MRKGFLDPGLLDPGLADRLTFLSDSQILSEALSLYHSCHPHLLCLSRPLEMLSPYFQERWSLGISWASIETQTRGSLNCNHWEEQLGRRFRA